MLYNEKHIQILDTAENLFASKGFEGTTVRDIAEKAGINVAMISYYFGSKEKLMVALFEHKTGHIKMRVESLLKDNSITPLQKINMLVDEHIERALQQQKFYKIMICEQVVNKNPVVLSLLNDVKIRNASIIGDLIKDGQKKGAFKKKIDVVLMLSTMIGTVNQMMINKSHYKEFNNINNLTDVKYEELLKEKLSTHVKSLFKSILTNEA